MTSFITAEVVHYNRSVDSRCGEMHTNDYHRLGSNPGQEAFRYERKWLIGSKELADIKSQ